jgi:hypothetical protein
VGAFFQTVKWQLQIAYWPAIKIFTKELRQVENIFVKKKTSEEHELELERVVVI